MLLSLVALSLLGLTWLGYPIGIYLLSIGRHRRRSVAWSPSVTCVLVSRDEPAIVRRRVANLLEARYDAAVDVVLALDATGADTSASDLAGVARLTVVVGDSPGKAGGLNAAVRAARGDVLVFADASQLFDEDAVAALVGALADRRLGAVSGALQLPSGGARSPAELYWSYERWLREHEARVHSTVGVTGAIYAMRRECWVPLPVGVLLDDVYTPMRLVLAGQRVGFCAAARATDTRRTQPGQEYKRKVRTLTGVLQLCAWMPDILVPVRNPIWLQFVCHKLLRLLTPWLLIAVVAGALWALAERLPARTFWFGMLAAVVAGTVASVLPAIGRRVRGLVVWGVTLQAAVIVATVNGLRGRWDVWQPPR